MWFFEGHMPRKATRHIAWLYETLADAMWLSRGPRAHKMVSSSAAEITK